MNSALVIQLHRLAEQIIQPGAGITQHQFILSAAIGRRPDGHFFQLALYLHHTHGSVQRQNLNVVLIIIMIVFAF